MLGISPHLIDFHEKLERGDRVIWHAGLRFLYCFAGNFCGDWNCVLHGAYTGMYEELSEMGKTDRSETRMIGVNFICADAQLVKHHHILETELTDGGLPTLSLLRDAVRFLKTHEEGIVLQKHRVVTAKLLRFARREHITIPHRTIEEILAPHVQH